MTQQVLDSANCNMPDYYIHKATTCACGDYPLRIPLDQRMQGLSERAHWCTGTLRMNDGFGNPIYVFNPFSYEELLQLIGPPGIVDAYLLCISALQSGTSADSCKKPTIPLIEEQGVSAISLIERCKVKPHNPID